MTKKSKKVTKKVTKKKVSKQKSKSASKKIVRKRKNPTDREDRIEELKLRLKEARKEMKGDKDRDPPTPRSTLWLIMQGEITRLEHLIDDLNYMSDDEYADFQKKYSVQRTKLLENKKRFSDGNSQLEKWHGEAFDNLPNKKKNWF